MNFRKATTSYESWLARQTPILESDLKVKHKAMSADQFSFLRATFYRWIQLWPKSCPGLARSPTVLAVGDLHVENFGTWRDMEGRLVWGINDFDEAYPLPYTNDLVRLAVSAHLAIAENHLAIRPADACDAILEGYAKALEAGGAPFILAEGHQWLRATVMSDLRNPGKFWERLDALPEITRGIPNKARKALESQLPERGLPYRVAHRVAGLGSLGRQRLVALADWRGGKIAREAKALVPSACAWANGDGKVNPQYKRILSRAIRCPDPFVDVRLGWIVRRLAPDCSRIELSSLPKGHDEYKLLEAMGSETANVHLGSKTTIHEVRGDYEGQPKGWLHQAAEEMARATIKDWHQWRS